MPAITGALVFTGETRAEIAEVEADHFVTDFTVLVAVTDAAINFEASPATKAYVEEFWPVISSHPAGFALAATRGVAHRNHLIEKVDGSPVQFPLVTASTCETVLMPEIAGGEVLTGDSNCGATEGVDAVQSDNEPDKFLAVTLATMNFPASRAVKT